MNLGPTELVIILLILLLLVGGRKLPDLARSLGTSITEFRNSTKEALEDDDPDASGGRQEPRSTSEDETRTRSDDEPRDRRDERDTRS